MEKREKLVEINDHITLINDHDDATCYLVRGTEKAMLIDTANGPLDLKTLCASLTDLPVTVVNTHGHCDHVFGNIWFEEAYLHPNDWALHDEHFRFEEMQEAMKREHMHPAKLLPVQVGDVFDLGGLMLEVVDLIGHTKGSIGLLDRKDRILFSGDGVNGHIWMQLDESEPISVLQAMLRRLEAEHGSEFDFILTGHGKELEDAKLRIEHLLKGCKELLAGDRANDQPYKCFIENSLSHFIGPDENNLIVYTKEKLK